MIEIKKLHRHSSTDLVPRDRREGQGEGAQVVHERFHWQKHLSLNFKHNEAENCFSRMDFRALLLHFLLQESLSLHSAIKSTVYPIPTGTQTIPMLTFLSPKDSHSAPVWVDKVNTQQSQCNNKVYKAFPSGVPSSWSCSDSHSALCNWLKSFGASPGKSRCNENAKTMNCTRERLHIHPT